MAAISDSHIEFIGYQIIQQYSENGLIDFTGCKNLDIDNKTTCFSHMTTELWSIYCYFNGSAAILKITTFRKSDYLRFLICFYWHPILIKSVEKPFVAIFFGSNHTRIIPLPNTIVCCSVGGNSNRVSFIGFEASSARLHAFKIV